MRVLVQRVATAEVTVAGRASGAIGPGLLLLVGITHSDDEATLKRMADKVVKLRIFADEAGLMNRSVLDVGGDVLAVSQFTLYADARKGRRPSYSDAAPPEAAKALYLRFLELLAAQGLKVEAGEFQAEMAVTYTNLGPVTILLDSKKTF